MFEKKEVTREDIREAGEILRRYREARGPLEARLIENERWFRLRHWDVFRRRERQDVEPASAWLFNALANKHADAMDNCPAPAVLPREESDAPTARALSTLLPAVLEQADLEQVWSDAWWYKLKTGTACVGVFWDTERSSGLGDVALRSVDLLNLYWEPGITDLQESRHVFHVQSLSREAFEERWPEMRGKAADGPSVLADPYDGGSLPDRVAVVDWYTRERRGGRSVVHLTKFAGGELLYSSRNDPRTRDTGFYDHGQYPFVLDVLFPLAGSPVGFGYLDLAKSPQEYIDRLDQAILKNAVMAGNPRFFLRQDGMIAEEEYADWSRPFIHFNGSGSPTDSVMPLTPAELPPMVVNVRQMKVEELKETSGNRDFSQGATASGVTAAAAIAALQEAGSKLTRDMVKSSYRAFAKVCTLCLELLRQFYTGGRCFRILGPGGEPSFMTLPEEAFRARCQGTDFGLDMGWRVPIFDISVTGQKHSPFSEAVENERAKELFSLGFFRPELADQALTALEMMNFEGIERVRERIAAGKEARL